jgi:hypothetical protein
VKSLARIWEEILALAVSRTLCHASSLEARPPGAHPAKPAKHIR